MDTQHNEVQLPSIDVSQCPELEDLESALNALDSSLVESFDQVLSHVTPEEARGLLHMVRDKVHSEDAPRNKRVASTVPSTDRPETTTHQERSKFQMNLEDLNITGPLTAAALDDLDKSLAPLMVNMAIADKLPGLKVYLRADKVLDSLVSVLLYILTQKEDPVTDCNFFTKTIHVDTFRSRFATWLVLD